MDNRLGGLIVVIVALVFLWLYDTGRWTTIKSVLTGSTPTQALTQSGYGILGTNSGSSYAANGSNGQTGDGFISSAVCSAWPDACSFLGGGSPASSSGGGGSLISDITDLGQIGSLFGLV